MTWESLWSDKLSTMVTASCTGNSFDRLEYTDTATPSGTMRDSFFVNTSFEQEQTLKAQGSLDIFNNGKLLTGADFKRCDFNIHILERPDTLRTYSTNLPTDTGMEVLDANNVPVVYSKDEDSRRVAYKYGGFVSMLWNPFERLRIIPGVRCDAFTYNNSFTVSPRLGAVFSVTPDLNLTGSAGVQYQDPDYADLVAAPENKNLLPKRAITGIIGTEYLLSKWATQLTAEVYYKQYSQMAVDSSLLSTDSLNRSDVLLSIGKGRSYGIELFAQKKLTSHFSGSLSYSLSKSENMDPRPGHEGQWYPGDYDFVDELTATAGYKIELLNYAWYKSIHNYWWFAALSPIMPLGDRMELSVKWRYLGGRPYTPLTADSLHREWIEDPQNLNSARFPSYHKLDIRFQTTVRLWFSPDDLLF